MRIRPLTDADSEAAAQVLVASIGALCGADHNDDPALIAGWIANKTPDDIRRWNADPGKRMLCAELDGRIAAVAGFSLDGEIQLNYVSPAFQRRGVSRALLTEMERRLAALELKTGRLHSTTTALRFYETAGWRRSGPYETIFGIRAHPMTKTLQRG